MCTSREARERMLKSIHLIMPMAGGGTRFLEQGMDLPKPIIKLRGEPFFYWAVQSLTGFIEVKDMVFVILKDHVEQYGIDDEIQRYYPDARIVVIPEVLKGAVLTCLKGIEVIDDDLPILFNDCDHAFISKAFYEYVKQGEYNAIDGALLTFRSDSPNYSYVYFNDRHEIAGTIEKQVLSNEAICGAYYFREKELFYEAAQKYIKHCDYKEYFMSGVYNEMISAHKKVRSFPLDEHISFGTPDEYRIAQEDTRLDMIRGNNH